MALRGIAAEPFSGQVSLNLSKIHELADGYRVAWDGELMDNLGYCEEAIKAIDAKRPKEPPEEPPEKKGRRKR